MGLPHPTELDVALRDGSSVHVRPVLPADREPLTALFAAMSTDSAYFRAFGVLIPHQLAAWAIDVDPPDRYGVVATTGPGGRIVGHAGYVRVNRARAEVAFEIADALHGQGIATLLLAHLASVAADAGIREFSAEVLPANHKMLGVFAHSGFPIRQEYDSGVITVVFETEMTRDTMARFDARERRAAGAALRSFLRPASVAVIGASDREGSLGLELMTNLVQGRYAGRLYPINPRRSRVCGEPALRSIADVGHPVDLAVIVVPAPAVLDVARECGAAGTRGLIVVSGGFAETDTAGAERQTGLLRICREAGMRLIGPNSLGILNRSLEVSLNASFIRALPTPGRVSLMSQSGGVGVALTSSADRLGIGMSSVVSVGNRADISGNDLLSYWDEDPDTDVILLYLESFGNPRRFSRVARHVSTHKPIIAVKSGITRIGASFAGESAAATLLAQADLPVDALFRQAGVIRTDTTAELLEAAALLSAQPAPAGPRVTVLSNSRGPAQLCADACSAAGLVAVAPTDPELGALLDRRPGSSPSGVHPVNLTTNATAADLQTAARLIAESGETDALITIFVPSLTAGVSEVAEVIDAVAADHPDITFASVLMDRVMPRPPHSPRRAVRFTFPEEAARALGHAAGWSQWRRHASRAVHTPVAARPAEARSLITQALLAGEGWLNPADTAAVLDLHGLAPDPAARPEPGESVLLVGVVQDPDFGPLLVCGGPGRALAVRIAPVSDGDAAEMAAAMETATRSAGAHARGLDAVALADLLVRVAAMVEAQPEVAALDLDPVIAGPGRVCIAGARMSVAQPTAARPFGALP